MLKDTTGGLCEEDGVGGIWNVTLGPVLATVWLVPTMLPETAAEGDEALFKNEADPDLGKGEGKEELTRPIARESNNIDSSRSFAASMRTPPIDPEVSTVSGSGCDNDDTGSSS